MVQVRVRVVLHARRGMVQVKVVLHMRRVSGGEGEGDVEVCAVCEEMRE